jgi:hypothetical protein
MKLPSPFVKVELKAYIEVFSLFNLHCVTSLMGDPSDNSHLTSVDTLV